MLKNTTLQTTMDYKALYEQSQKHIEELKKENEKYKYYFNHMEEGHWNLLGRKWDFEQRELVDIESSDDEEDPNEYYSYGKNKD